MGILFLILIIAYPKPAKQGYAARYSTNQVMERAAAHHGVTPRKGEDICASPIHALHTHLVVHSKVRGNSSSIRCVVGDIAHPRDRAHILRRGIVVELTPRAALVICGSIREPPRQCPVVVEVVME
jgi:hypothetical protein